MYKDHFFDFPNQLKSQRVRRDDITTGIVALRNTDGVRQWFTTVEGDILSEIRGGNKVYKVALLINITYVETCISNKLLKHIYLVPVRYMFKTKYLQKLKTTSNNETAKQQSLTLVYGWTTSILCTLCNNN